MSISVRKIMPGRGEPRGCLRVSYGGRVVDVVKDGPRWRLSSPRRRLDPVPKDLALPFERRTKHNAIAEAARILVTNGPYGA